MTEILAPAGGENSAYAAINSGADAIYLGLDRFSARSSAENFNTGNFAEICKYAHAFGVKVYAALNTIVKDGELESFLSAVKEAWNCGADAIIMQDIFLGRFIKKCAPQIKLHLSTQAGTCNEEGAYLAKEYGFDRVILARETKFEDIQKITKIIETEVFVQGALCSCFSGQCYLSSFAGGNSGNRGKCKQPCRKLYSIDRQGFEENAYAISLSDLSVGADIKKYIEAGVTSFKIEGRMRRPEYVAAAVTYYKNILSGKAESGLGDLKRTYNRGNYTKGLAFGQDKTFLSSAVQGHIGEFVGIIKVENSKYICQSANKFSRGDGFKILRGGKEVGGGTFAGEAKGGFIIASRDRLKNGDKAFITTDVKLNERLLARKRLIPVKINAKFLAGQTPYVEINGMPFKGCEPLEIAQSRPLTEEEIKRNFIKTDVYPFAVSFGEISTDGVFIAASALNAFRRKVFAEYYEKISENKNVAITSEFPVPEVVRGENNKTAVICTDLRGVKADIGILKLNSFTEDLPLLLSGFTGEKFLYVPPYLTGEEVSAVEKLVSAFDGIYCDSYFGVKLAEKLKKPLFAGTGFNIANSVSLSGCQAKYICLSKEITLAESEPLTSSNAFYLTAGNIKVMDLIYCPFERKCSTCDRRVLYTLTDAENRKFPLRRYKTSECRFEVYNCANLVCRAANCGKLFDFSLENAAEVSHCAHSVATLEKAFKNHTRGHSVSGIY